MLDQLLAAIEMLSKAKDVKGLIAQERLELMIEFLEKIGDIHIDAAIVELREAEHSTRPEKEVDRAVGDMKVAAQALSRSLERRPLLKRLVRADKYKRMVKYFKLTGCYAIITGIYRIQGNAPLARKYALLTKQAFWPRYD